MPKLLIAFASAMLLLASSGIWNANAATITNAGTLAPLTKSYAPAEHVAYWRRQYRRAYRRGYYGYGYGYPYYGYAYPAYPAYPPTHLPSLPVLRLRLQAIRLLRLRLALLRSSGPLNDNDNENSTLKDNLGPTTFKCSGTETWKHRTTRPSHSRTR